MGKTTQNINEIIEKAFTLRKERKHLEALNLYNSLISTTDNLPKEIYFNRGNILYDLGKNKVAKNDFLNILKLDKDFTPALIQLARCEIKLGNKEVAKDYYNRLLQLEPQNFSAWLEIGHLYRFQGQNKQMIISYKHAVTILPQRWEGWLSLARAFEDDAQWDEAAASYHKAILSVSLETENSNENKDNSKKPSLIRSIHWNMAKYRLERGDYSRSLDSMRQAIMALRLEHNEININEKAEMQMDLADILMRIGLKDEAYRAFERASMATDEAILSSLASLSFRYNLWKESQEILKRNVELHPNSAFAHWNLAHSYAESWQLDEALEQLAKAQEISFQPGAESMKASIAGKKGDAKKALDIYMKIAKEEGPYSLMNSSAAMSSLYSDELSAQEVANLHKELFTSLGVNARSIDSFKNDRKIDKKLKIGFVSADFHHQHPVNIFMQPVLARINQNEFNTTIYFTGVTYDNQTQLAKRRVSNWIECSKFTDEQLLCQIENDEIDILIDLSGHTSLHRMHLFAKRAAPVQVSFLGYPSSTGVPNIDWIIGDNIVTSKGSEDIYSENIYRLPNTVFCFSPEQDYPYPDYSSVKNKKIITFGSFNNVPKLTSHTIKVWSKILHEVPDSKLILKAPSFQDKGAIDFFIKRFEKEGINSNKLEFRGPVGLDEMMQEYADIDIALDPFPYNGGTTTLQAMWMGVPVVVKKGNNFVSNMGASFMSAAGLVDWVALNDDEYVEIAKKKAHNKIELYKLKQIMRDKLIKTKAWDIDLYTKNFEISLKNIWKEFCLKETK